jgi:hypothetical protein
MNPMDEGKELIRMWQENTLPPPPDPSQFARDVAMQVRNFDRRIFWRNFREYAAGALFIAMMMFNVMVPERRLLGVAGIAATLFVMFFLWWSHRKKEDLDPSSDARSYQAALLARYDHQIRLLRNVKYWYVLPLYSWMLFALSGKPGMRLPYFTLMTAFSLFVIWLNEGYGVKKLREKRKIAEDLLAISENHETEPASGNPPSESESL